MLKIQIKGQMLLKNKKTDFGKVVYENKSLFVIDKKSGIRSEEISKLICHRLDKDTSGLLIVAKNQKTKDFIQKQFKKREIKKEYIALVLGKIQDKETVEGYIFRDNKAKEKRKFQPSFNIKNFNISGKNHERYSKTEIIPVQNFHINLFKNSSRKDLNYFTLVIAKPITGRTHQIRLHLAYLHHPILGETLYGGKIIKIINKRLYISRLMLHAEKITFANPETQKRITFKTKLPIEFIKIINKMEKINVR